MKLWKIIHNNKLYIPDLHLLCNELLGHVDFCGRGSGKPCCRWSRLHRTAAAAAAAVGLEPPTDPAGGTAALDKVVAVVNMEQGVN